MSGFDRLARPYRWMEYLTFGRLLERCRFQFLSRFVGVRRALVLGDGDGRFCARLLAAAPDVRVDAVDGSAAMLAALRGRCAFAADRLVTREFDLSRGLPVLEPGFDLVASHFFLDCLSDEAVERLVAEVRPLLRPGAVWVVSEFAVSGWASAAVVRGLYLGFRVLTGLRVRRLPEYRAVLVSQGFVCVDRVTRLGGLLVAEMWRIAD